MNTVKDRARWAAPLIAAAGLGLAGAARGQDVAPLAQAPAPPAAPTACVLVVGGGIPVTPDPKVNSFWLAVNKVVSADVQSELTRRGYAADEIIADSPDPRQRLAAVTRQLTQDRCEKAIQVSVALVGAAETPDVAASFEFDILVFHLDISDVPGKPMKQVRLAGDYRKAYAYPLTKQVMDTLSMTQVSARIAGDIDAAKVLPLAK